MNDTIELRQRSKQVRRDILTLLLEAGWGYPGSALSCVEILVTLYWEKLRVEPGNPGWPDRDRFVLSKWHAAHALYSVLTRRGFLSFDELLSLAKPRSSAQSVSSTSPIKGVDVPHLSLGQGLSVACGLALSARMAESSRRVYCLMGDGELQEGQVWECALTCSAKSLDNLCAVIDVNEFQAAGKSEDIKPMKDPAQKFRSFGWHSIDVAGHDVEALLAAYSEAESVKGKPTAILAATVKGKGVSFMESNPVWHSKSLSERDYEQAMRELK
jgi:transketolase